MEVVVSVGQGDGQGLRSGPGQGAATARRSIDQSTEDSDHERADSEQGAAGAEWDIERHDFIPL